MAMGTPERPSMWMKRAIILLPAAAIGLYLLGGWLQSLHGLDPPYAIFFAGFILKLAAACIAVGVLVLVVVACIRYPWL